MFLVKLKQAISDNNQHIAKHSNLFVIDMWKIEQKYLAPIVVILFIILTQNYLI